MEVATPTMDALFAQLGLPNSRKDIDEFLDAHSPLPHKVLLADAPFWTSAQAAFLKQALKDDADWAVVVDELSTLLRFA